jgi:hypothetical protein
MLIQNAVFQMLYPKWCIPKTSIPNVVFQILYPKFCIQNVVFQMLYPRFYIPHFISQMLYLKCCIPTPYSNKFFFILWWNRYLEFYRCSVHVTWVNVLWCVPAVNCCWDSSPGGRWGTSKIWWDCQNVLKKDLRINWELNSSSGPPG